MGPLLVLAKRFIVVLAGATAMNVAWAQSITMTPTETPPLTITATPTATPVTSPTLSPTVVPTITPYATPTPVNVPTGTSGSFVALALLILAVTWVLGRATRRR